MAPLHLPSPSYTEVEFSIRPTTDASTWRTTSSESPMEGRPPRRRHRDPPDGSEPALLASPVQVRGVAVGPAAGSSPALTYRSSSRPSRHRQAGADGPDAGMHGPYGIAADQCALCHSAHAAQAPYSLVAANRRSRRSASVSRHGGHRAPTRRSRPSTRTRPSRPNDPGDPLLLPARRAGPDSGHTLGRAITSSAA